MKLIPRLGKRRCEFSIRCMYFILPLRITVSTYGFGPYGGSSILSGVTKMVIWPSGLGAGLQNLLRGFKSYYHLRRVRWKPKNRWWIYVHQNTERSRTIDGSYPTIEWSVTISRYKLPRWRNGSVFVLHTNGGGSIPPRGTIMVHTIPHRKGSVIG